MIADYIKSHSRPDDCVVVLGSEPEVFFYAKRNSGTGYVYNWPLMEPQPYARTMQEEMIRDIETKKPEFLVSVVNPIAWPVQANSDTYILKWLHRYVPEHYYPVGLAEVMTPERVDYRWDNQVVGAEPRSNCYVWVLRRKPDARPPAGGVPTGPH